MRKRKGVLGELVGGVPIVDCVMEESEDEGWMVEVDVDEDEACYCTFIYF